MEVLSIFAIVSASYFAGASPISGAIGILLRSYCPICGTKSDQFVRTAANIIKGCLVVSFAALFGPLVAQLAALFVLLGHLYPVQRNFKGGNGMAILLGAMVALHPLLGLIALFSWLFGYFVFRYASLSAVMSALVTTMSCHYLELSVSMYLMALLAGIVIWRHREGLARVAEGTEEMVVWD